MRTRKGTKQERKLFMMYSLSPKKFILKSSMKQSTETIVSELDPISLTGENRSITKDGKVRLKLSAAVEH